MGSRRVTDYDILRKYYTFLNDEKDNTWESNLVSSYHESLFKEYAVCDLSRYESGNIGLRWRSAHEVVSGKCEKICANTICNENANLKSYEVLFNYKEHDTSKQALVKVRVCKSCSKLLNYKKEFKTIAESSTKKDRSNSDSSKGSSHKKVKKESKKRR
ncbi:hypothetical protein BEWA_020380 [Theileria equi strain WA]|uniref:Protein FRA10AC1 n=1 Tax=Theileria equi strain WA TaxID=1537102 RepID=L0AU70_THEEQ|nr:hypothetical protein BEWA_020380 [Theileria equi strain WA]AFZ79192.1 hypothetical protein BEWA_020380 [Theileria equi strain WA]|eukprot:XP_004828858.1 hypothetical protein BEWA_020380 [Theileria equi strain WA]